MTNFIERLMNPLTLQITIFMAISTIPMILYVAFFRKDDNGNGLEVVGFYLIKLLRKFK